MLGEKFTPDRECARPRERDRLEGEKKGERVMSRLNPLANGLSNALFAVSDSYSSIEVSTAANDECAVERLEYG